MLISSDARPQSFGSNIVLIGFLSVFLAAAPATAGQGAANPAGITSVVTDNSGAVLPGVTVTATSPALQVPSVTGVSDERGKYRPSPLPIGLYPSSPSCPAFRASGARGCG